MARNRFYSIPSQITWTTQEKVVGCVLSVVWLLEHMKWVVLSEAWSQKCHTAAKACSSRFDMRGLKKQTATMMPFCCFLFAVASGLFVVSVWQLCVLIGCVKSCLCCVKYGWYCTSVVLSVCVFSRVLFLSLQVIIFFVYLQREPR